MVGLSDIPCVGKFVDKISDATVDAFFRGLRYLFCYKELVNVLNSEIENVNIQEDRVVTKSVKERTDGKIIKDHVLKWQTEVDEFQEGAKEFSEKFKNRASWTCLKCLLIPKPVSRFRLGRDAVLKARRATELVASGKELLADEIAHFPPIENLPRNDAEFQDFPSRKYVYGKLWEALITEGSSLILGIYGMPGVGKTRMMEQIWKEAKEEKIFNKVARADVGTIAVDVIKLQNQIAGHLNCHFQSQDNVESRADQLKNSLMYGGKILIILDDVWSEIPLEHIIGTSFGESSSSKGSKILLTSRSKKVCSQNNCKYTVQIKTLTNVEAWDLFQNTVGTCHIDSLQDETLAKEVCSKCAGLPLLIRAVGKTLQSMSRHVWKDALQKLEKGSFKNIPDIDPQVYACVKLSIDRLSEDAKLCLLLCSLFPEDADIHIAKLIQFAIGSQFIPDGESTVRAVVDILTKSSLLLQCDRVHITKMHDIIRDVARSISSTDPKYAFSHVKCGSRLPENAGYSALKLLRLDVESDYAQFPKDLVCTDLGTLWLHCKNHLQQFSGDFFYMFENLGFLMLQNVHFCSEHFSLQPLSKLKMLIFDKCDIRKTDVSLFPKNISTLSIWRCNLPSPLDLPKLEYLQKLDIQQEYHEVIMVPNAISSLSSLEELHIPYGFRFSDDAKDITLILDEIGKLIRLTSLKIYLSNFEACQGTSIFFKLLRYDISVGGDRENFLNQELPDSTRMIEFINIKVKRDETLQSLVGRAEEVNLDSTDVDVCSIWNSDREAFAELRRLSIDSSDTMEYIARISQDEIQRSRRQPRTCFSKLTYLYITHCSAMKYLFCKSAAKCLVQLQELSVYNCSAMEVIVMNEGTSDGEIINFPKLKTLQLFSLPSLRSFYREKKEMHREKSEISCGQVEALFDGMVAFPSLELLEIEHLYRVTDIWGKKHYYDENHNNNNIVSSSSSFCKLKTLFVCCDRLESIIPDAMLHRLRNLERLNIRECSSLRNAFSPCIATHLIHLQELYIENCEMMREIIGGGEQEDITAAHNNDHGIIVFPELTSLELGGLKNLSSFWYYQNENEESYTYKVKFPSLEVLVVYACGINLECIELSGDDSTCPLKTLSIFNWMQVPCIWQLPCKWQLHLYNLETLTLRRCWSDELKSLRFPKLRNLEVSNCGGRSSLFRISGFRSLQKLQTLEISAFALLKEIVEDVSGDEHAGMDAKTIRLLQLKSVVFKDLPNLRSFIHGVNYECYMPALKTVEIDNCGLSSLFTCSVFRNLQQLQRLKISKCALLEEIVEDVTGEEHPGMDAKTFRFLQLESVVFKDLPNLKSFIRGANYECYMPALKEVEVDNCGLSSLFTCSVFRNLQQLQRLKISKCALLEKIVGDVTGEEHPGMDAKTIRFLQLESVVFKDLPNLKNFIRGTNYECYMPALKEVEVNNCGLSSLFTCSVFRNLQQLETLRVLNCELLVDIIKDGMGVETSEGITLSQLSSVALEDLPNLKSFSLSVSCAFGMPKLKEFHLLGCPQLENFTCLKTTTGLVSVYTEEHKQEAVTDLNDFIIQNRNRRSNLMEVLENQELETESGIVEEEQLRKDNNRT